MIKRLRVILSICLLAGLVSSSSVTAQQAIKPATPEEITEQTQVIFNSNIPTNHEATATLNLINQALINKNFNDALLLLQHLTDTHGQVMVSFDGRRCLPARILVQQILSDPNYIELRQLYLLEADAVVAAIIGKDVYACRDESTLQTVVQRYFMSSTGDEAAYVLGCLKLDQGDIPGAWRLFNKVTEHPDWLDRKNNRKQTVDPKQLYIRMALVKQRIGATKDSFTLLTQAKQIGADTALIQSIKQLLSSKKPSDKQTDHVQWHSQYGNPQGNGVMADMGLAGATAGKDHQWASTWRYGYSLRLPMISTNTRYYNNSRKPPSRSMIISRWKQHNWLPTGQLLIDGNRAIFRAHDVLVCLDITTGQELWKSRPPQENRSTRQTYYPYSYGGTNTAFPSQALECMAFGDRVLRSISMVGPNVYTLEGKPILPMAQPMPRIINGRISGLVFDHTLTAYQASSGKFRWKIKLTENLEYRKLGIGSRILTSPVDIMGRLLVVFEDNRQLYATLLDPANGKQLMKPIFLCSMNNSMVAWSKVGVAVDGQMAYICNRQGLVFAINGLDGQIEWAYNYARTKPQSDPALLTAQQKRFMAMTRYGRLGVGESSLADSSVFISAGKLIVVSPDDGSVLVMDPTQGHLIRRIENENLRYAAGLIDGDLLIAEKHWLTRYNLDNGETQWKASIKGATGKIAVTKNAIFVPADSSIIRIDPVTGRRQTDLAASTPKGVPLGNLYSDGTRLLNISFDQITSLVDSPIYIQKLAKRIRQGDATAFVERASLNRQAGRYDDAIKDLKLAYPKLTGQSRIKLQKQLVDVLIALAEKQPDRAIDALNQANQRASTDGQKIRIKLALADHWRKKDPIKAATSYLELASTYGDQMIDQSDRYNSYHVRIDRVATWRLQQLQASDQQTITSALQRRGAELLKQAFEQNQTASISQLARLLWGSEIGQVAATVFARSVAQINNDKDKAARFEQADILLADLGRSGDRSDQAYALALRAELYESMGWSLQAAGYWHTLASRFADVTFNWNKQLVVAEQLVQQRFTALNLTDKQLVPSQLQPPLAKLWAMPRNNQILLTMPQWMESPSEYLQRHVLFFEPNWKRLTCRRVKDKTAVWSMKLPDNMPLKYLRSSYSYSIDGGASEHILVARNGKRMIGIGMVSGRLLWDTTTQEISLNRIPMSRDLAQRLYRRFDVGFGVITEAARAEDGLSDLLETKDVLTGQTLWRRTVGSNSIMHVAVTDRAVIAVLSQGETFLALDRQTGRLLHRTDLSNNSANGKPIPAGIQLQIQGRVINSTIGPLRNSIALITSDSLIHYSGKKLYKRNLLNGQIEWQHAGQASYRRIQKIGNRYLALIHSNQDMELLDMVSGKTMWKVPRAMIGYYVYDIALAQDGKTLYVCGRVNNRDWGTTLINTRTGKMQAQINQGRNVSYRMSALSKVMAGEYIPSVVRDKSNSRVSRVLFHNRKNGQLTKNMKLPVTTKNDQIQYMNIQPFVLDGSLIVMTNQEIMAFGSQAKEIKEVKEVEKESVKSQSTPKSELPLPAKKPQQ